ncbi:ParB/RepB/Spo0J family partition protein [Leptospira ognonensis]|uniref:ParB/RepB/Spo0J family partition protein n=1 Tax=Leptospira ognonensis TaxID=2484945 RepID=A0A4R9K336_9LEPT|nr:ParB/RepB/Spo0J family partition protein [Leptospira ognonensis]TGL58657.1 ParB/RepB/Spo0J family partition protein [Leptospira ognonensis]
MKGKSNFDPSSILSRAGERSASPNVFLNTNGTTQHNTIDIPVSEITVKENPRKQFNDITIRELAESISAYGLLQPIVVRKKDGKYELINGERRLRAHLLLKRKTIIAIIKNVEQLDPSKLPEIKLIENLQREDLRDADLALSLSELKKRHNETNEQLAKRLNKSAQWIKMKITHAEVLKEGQGSAKLPDQDVLSEIPTSLFTELAPLEKAGRQKALNFLVATKTKTGEFPARADFREFVRPLKVTNPKKAKPKSVSLDSLKAELNKVKQKITELQYRKQEIEDAIKKAKRS